MAVNVMPIVSQLDPLHSYHSSSLVIHAIGIIWDFIGRKGRREDVSPTCWNVHTSNHVRTRPSPFSRKYILIDSPSILRFPL